MPNRVQSNPQLPCIKRSDALYARALGLIPAVTQTLAKGPGQHIRGVAPKYLQRGLGSHVWDVDGNEFLDFTMAVGPLSLGYCYAPVDDAIRRQLESGITFSLMHPLEVEVAELVREMIPNAERVRFSKTGCDVTTRQYDSPRLTGREKVLCCGYHGWHDWYIAVTDRNMGIPQATRDLTFTFSYNDIDSVIDSIDDDIACIILEPVVFEAPRDGFLQRLRELCDRAWHRADLRRDVDGLPSGAGRSTGVLRCRCRPCLFLEGSRQWNAGLDVDRARRDHGSSRARCLLLHHVRR